MTNKVILYKVILKPVRTYGIQLWRIKYKNNNDKKISVENNTAIINALITDVSIHKDLEMLTVKGEVKKYSKRYLQRINNHSNILAISLLDDSEEVQRLKRDSEKNNYIN